MVLRIIFFVIATALLTHLKASHFMDSNIQIRHLSGFQYELFVDLVSDFSSIGPPPQLPIEVYSRSGQNLIETFTVILDTTIAIPGTHPSCFSWVDKSYSTFRDTIHLDPLVYSDPGGYYFTYDFCCLYTSINFQNTSFEGTRHITLFPPVVDQSGSPIFNSSPVTPIIPDNILCLNKPISLDFSCTDPDGDSLDYVLFTPFNEGNISAGTSSSLTHPYADPNTQFPKLNYSSGYSINNMIPGNPGPAPSPNRLKVNNQSGEVTFTADSTLPIGNYIFGVWVREYRAGQMIGSTFIKSHVLLTFSSWCKTNQAPQTSVELAQNYLSWSGDTIIANGFPACLYLSVSDGGTDTTTEIINLEARSSIYNSSELLLALNQGVLNLPGDTFSTSLCIQPSNINAGIVDFDIIVENDLCSQILRDTLNYWISYQNYPKAGTGGIFNETVGSSSMLDLFSLLSDNPNSGGLWESLENSLHFDPNGFFDGAKVNSASEYNFYYINTRPNYPADTAFIKLVFQNQVGLANSRDEDIVVFPNPSDGKVNISLGEKFKGKRIYLYNTQLKLIESSVINHEIEILDFQQNGLYILRYEGAHTHHKIIIN